MWVSDLFCTHLWIWYQLSVEIHVFSFYFFFACDGFTTIGWKVYSLSEISLVFQSVNVEQLVTVFCHFSPWTAVWVPDAPCVWVSTKKPIPGPFSAAPQPCYYVDCSQEEEQNFPSRARPVPQPCGGPAGKPVGRRNWHLLSL